MQLEALDYMQPPTDLQALTVQTLHFVADNRLARLYVLL